MVVIKSATSYSEQIDKLVSREMVVNDKEFAINKLKNIGYYRLTGYSKSLEIEKDKYASGTTFEQVIRIYDFDEQLRNMLMDILVNIEISYKARISHEFSLKYNSDGHYYKDNFKKLDNYVGWLNDLNRSVNQASKRKEIYASHHMKKYDNHFPTWVALEMVSFGTLSKFYANLHDEFAKHISKDCIGLSDVYLKNWLHVFSVVRNSCAHNCRLYNSKFTITPKINKKDNIQKDRVFVIVYLVNKGCLDRIAWELFYKRLKILIAEYEEDIDFSKIGFPKNWQSYLE